MKNTIRKILPCLLASTSAVPFLATSCQSNIQQPEVEIDDWWITNYVFNIDTDTKRLEAPYQFNLKNFKGGETITITIVDQTDIEGTKGNYVCFEDGKFTKEFKVDAEHSDILNINLKLAKIEWYVDDEFSFNAEIKVTDADGKTFDTKSKRMYMEVAKPTLPKHFLTDGNGVITGFNDEFREEFNDCTLLAIPNKIETANGTETITEIKDNAFYVNNQSTIPASVRYLLLDSSWDTNPTLERIGGHAFERCSLKGHLYIPRSVKTIGEYAFRHVTFNGLTFGYTDASVGECELETIEGFAFYGCQIPGNLVLPNKLKTIGEQCFVMSRINGDIILPSSLSSIGKYAFSNLNGYHDEGIGKIIIPKDMQATSLPESCFYTSNMTGELWIPDNMTQLGQYSCALLTAISAISLHSGLFLNFRSLQNMLSLSCIDLTRVTSIAQFPTSPFEGVFECTNPRRVTQIEVLLKEDNPDSDEDWMNYLVKKALPKDMIKITRVK